MEAVRGKDSAAFSTLYDRYSQTIYALCLRALRDPGEAEDLLIDIFYEMWDRADRYDPARSSPTSYVMGVARSRVVDRLRSLKSRRRISAGSATVVLEALPDASPSAAPPGEAIELAERRMRIVLAMRTLSPPQRQALEMAFFDSMTHAEVAEALKEPVGTIKSRIRQALIQLRKALGSEP
jgi:RNA polymerase sigma-70 factor (ECF subfamily)